MTSDRAVEGAAAIAAAAASRIPDSADAALRERLSAILRADPLIWAALQKARSLDAPDWRIVSGAVYNTVWNALAGRPSGYGIADIDLFYFDGADLSYAAEDAVIRRAAPLFADLPVPVELRNQARAHLWVGAKFGVDYPQLRSSDDALVNFVAQTHAVAVSLGADGVIDIAAPFGLSLIFERRLVPNRRHDNQATYERKAARAVQQWPEVTVQPW